MTIEHIPKNSKRSVARPFIIHKGYIVKPPLAAGWFVERDERFMAYLPNVISTSTWHNSMEKILFAKSHGLVVGDVITTTLERPQTWWEFLTFRQSKKTDYRCTVISVINEFEVEMDINPFNPPLPDW